MEGLWLKLENDSPKERRYLSLPSGSNALASLSASLGGGANIFCSRPQVIIKLLLKLTNHKGVWSNNFCQQKMKALVCFFVFSEVLSLLALGVFSCDCAVDSIQTREGSIRDNWNYADDVFAARVDDMYCKCYPQAESVNTLNCIHIKADASDTGRLVAINEQEITCQSGRGFMSLYYQNCDYVMGKARSSASKRKG